MKSIEALHLPNPCEEPVSQGRAIRYNTEKDESGHIVITGIELISTDGSRISSTDWREANPLGRWEDIALTRVRVVNPVDNTLEVPHALTLGVAEAANLRSRGPSSLETIQIAADAYNLAAALGIPESKTVQRVFSANGALDPLPRATASGWIRRAKDSGLINEGQETP
ncbi:hypothetical protein GMA10_05995 [Kocuria koreensis]|uniref:Uncharacterized protein n=1 Tax=Rothia koreensis TaxID=592378 RepID=A0A7K1LHV5_9MICC|nr:hypothetical protein [Rothia koreensis]MUN54764.1 hypothetical protein [Rothia koreensis]